MQNPPAKHPRLTRAALGFLGLTALFLTTAPGTVRAAEILVGGTSIQVPEPEGFARLTAEHQPIYGAIEAFVPESNTLKIYFVPQGDFDLIQAGESPGVARGYSIQTVKELDNQRFTAKDFKEFCKLITAQQDEFRQSLEEQTPGYLEKAKAGFKDKTSVELGTLEMQMVPLPPYEETETSLALTNLITTTSPNDSGVLIRETTPVDTSFVLARGKIIVLYYSSPDNVENLEPMQAAAKKWRDAVLAANPVTASDKEADAKADSASGRPGFFARVGRTAVIGAVIGALVGVVMSLVNKKKTPPAPPAA